MYPTIKSHIWCKEAKEHRQGRVDVGAREEILPDCTQNQCINIKMGQGQACVQVRASTLKWVKVRLVFKCEPAHLNGSRSGLCSSASQHT